MKAADPFFPVVLFIIQGDLCTKFLKETIQMNDSEQCFTVLLKLVKLPIYTDTSLAYELSLYHHE